MDQMVETFSELQKLTLGFLDMTEKADFWKPACNAGRDPAEAAQEG